MFRQNVDEGFIKNSSKTGELFRQFILSVTSSLFVRILLFTPTVGDPVGEGVGARVVVRLQYSRLSPPPSFRGTSPEPTSRQAFDAAAVV